MGCSVLALCYDEHHRKNLEPLLVQRAVEAMLGSNTMVFHNESLVARAKQLRLMKEDTKEDKKDDQKEDKKEDKKEEKKEGKNEETPRKKKRGKTKKKRKPTSSESDSDFDSSSLEETPKKKKGNMGKA